MNAPEKAAVENTWRFMNTPLYLDVVSVMRFEAICRTVPFRCFGSKTLSRQSVIDLGI
jgi:hypothetical protein